MLKHMVVCCVLLLAACGPGEIQPTALAPAGHAAAPTLPPPEWVEPAAPITIDNVSQISYLGRLDAPGTPSTLFTYAFSPDSTRLAALNNEQLLAWNLIGGQLIFSTARLDATEVYYSPDKTEIYTLDGSGTVQVYDAETGVPRNSFRAHTSFGNVAAFNRDQGWLAVGGTDGEVKVWDTLKRQSLVALQAHPDQAAALVFSLDGELLATAGASGIVRVWKWRDKQIVASVDQENAGVTRMTFSPDGAQLAVAASNGITLWSVPDNALDFTLESGVGATTDVLAYSPDGRYLVNGGTAADMRVWDPQTGKQVATLPDIGGDRASSAFSPDGQLLLVSVLDKSVTLWDLTRISDQAGSRADLNIGSSRILYVDWTTDGFLMAFFDATGPVYLWGIPSQSSPSS